MTPTLATSLAGSPVLLLAPASARAPEWAGWLVLGALIAAFSLLVWWLYFSPLPYRVEPPAATARTLRTRRRVATLALLAGALFIVGARWDELWHRMYGGFGNDFLWPPHLMLYGSLGLNGLFAGFGLGRALRGRGGLRERFRAEPLIGLLGLLAAYQLASIPSDQLWHQIIGPDLTAWSLPHVLLVVTSSASWLSGLALALATVRRRPWRNLARPAPAEVVALLLVGVSELLLLQLATTEWEWLTIGTPGVLSAAFRRPAWTYPVVVLLVGIATAHLTLYATRRVGAASAVALGVLLAQAAMVAITRALLPPGPLLASHLLLVLPAFALDAWYGLRRRHVEAAATLLGGAALYSAIFFAVAFPYIARFMAVPALDATNRIAAIAVSVPLALLAGVATARTGAWLGTLEVARQDGPAAPIAGVDVGRDRAVEAGGWAGD